jgi:hypothetical protein
MEHLNQPAAAAKNWRACRIERSSNDIVLHGLSVAWWGRAFDLWQARALTFEHILPWQSARSRLRLRLRHFRRHGARPGETWLWMGGSFVGEADQKCDETDERSGRDA